MKKLLLFLLLVSFVARSQPLSGPYPQGGGGSGGATNGIQQLNGIGTNTTIVSSGPLSSALSIGDSNSTVRSQFLPNGDFTNNQTIRVGGGIVGNGSGLTNISASAINGILFNQNTDVAPNGNDSIAVRGGFVPFATPKAAVQASLPGDTVHIWAGLYTNQIQILSNGVNLDFVGTVLMSNFVDDTVASSWKPIMDDSIGPITNRITGKPNFYINIGTNVSVVTSGFGTNKHPTFLGSTNFLDYVSITNPGTVLRWSTGTWTIEDHNSVAGRRVLDILGCTNAMIDFDDIIPGTNIVSYVTNSQTWTYPQYTNVDDAIVWGFGDVSMVGKKIGPMFQYGEWSGEPSDSIIHTNNFFLTCPDMQSKIYTSTAPTNTPAMDAVYRSWYNVDWLHCSNAYAGECVTFQGGYNYLNFQKISDDKVGGNNITVLGTANAWLTGHKITANGGWWLKTWGGGNTNGNSSVHMNVLEYDATASGVSATGGFLFQGQQRVDIEGGDCHVPSGIPVFYNNATGSGGLTNNGQVYLKNMTIDNSAGVGATNYPVIVDTNGLFLQNCVIIAPTNSESIFSATAQNVGILGGNMANRLKDANVTLSPLGTFTVDANVK